MIKSRFSFHHHLLLPLCILIICILSACASDPEPGGINNVRFALRDENIRSWHETGNGFEVQLSEDGRRRIHALTRDYHDKNLEIYAGRMLVNVSTIDRTLRGDAIFVSADDDVRERVIAFLPPSKREP